MRLDTPGDPDAAWVVWVTREQEGWRVEPVPRHLLLHYNPDSQNRVWATSPT